MRDSVLPAHFRASGTPAAGSPVARRRADDHVIELAGVTLIADPAGVLYWPEEKLLLVADLHLEKGSSFAARGVLLPPYDTATTLSRLARLIARYAPRALVALGDSFHDGGGPARMADADRAALLALQLRRDWIWIAGNHDPDPAHNIGGGFADSLAVGTLIFRHRPSPAGKGEIAGHLHPLACVARRGRAVRRSCFACDGRRAILPAFGAFTGGLNVRDRAFVAVFGTLSFTAHLLGAGRIYAVPAARCLAD